MSFAEEIAEGYPPTAPDGSLWTLRSAIATYGVPVPEPVLRLASLRTKEQVKREAAEMRVRSSRAWAESARKRAEDRMAEEWEAAHAGR